MNIPTLAVKKPVLVASLVLFMLFCGIYSLVNLPVSLFPQTDVPFFTITTPYLSAGPKEIEAAVSKPLEDELSSLEGLKNISVISQDSLSIVAVEFYSNLNIDSIEQRIRDKVSLARSKFPKEVGQSVIERFNPSNQSVITAFIQSDKKNIIELTSYVNSELRSSLEKISKVGRIEIIGGLNRQIDIVIDPKKIDHFKFPMLQIVSGLQGGGTNIPAGSIKKNDNDISIRTMGEFNRISDIENKVIAFSSGDNPVRIKDLGIVKESSEKSGSLASIKGKKGIILQIYKQSGSNTVQVASDIKSEIERLNKEMKKSSGVSIEVIRDGSTLIRNNILDVCESIIIGIFLTIIVVYFFLGSIRSTLITGFAIPNSLIGSFIFMSALGFSVNILTLLALSLCVGLLVDDAIVVRENIFRYIELGKSSIEAAVLGANEVSMAVVAVTAAILSMFGPVGFLTGVTGEFFREFGLVVCFAMLISLFDAMAVAPMLSAYFGGKHTQKNGKNIFHYLLLNFKNFQIFLEEKYKYALTKSLRNPVLTLILIGFIALCLGLTILKLPSSFLPTDQSGEFTVRVILPKGTSISKTEIITNKLNDYLMKKTYIDSSFIIVGNAQEEVHKAEIFVKLKSKKERQGRKPSELREDIQNELDHFEKIKELSLVSNDAHFFVIPNDITGAGQRPFTLVLQTKHINDLEMISNKIFEEIRHNSSFRGIDLELEKGSEEIQVKLVDGPAHRLGVNPALVGPELRARIEGVEVAKLREKGVEIPVKLIARDSSNIWLSNKEEILVPNINMTPVDLRKVAVFENVSSPAKIERVNRSYSSKITADFSHSSAPDKVIEETNDILTKWQKIYPELTWKFEGDAESFDELQGSMSKAFIFGILLLFLVLSSLYNSFLLSLLNILTLPMAISGAFFSLWLFHEGLNIYSVIGILLLLGVAAKNSILLIDTVTEKFSDLKLENSDVLAREIISSSVRRLRPILMTSFALIAGCIPIAFGLNEASAQRIGMGIVIVGGTMTSTIFTIFLIPSMILVTLKIKSRL